MRQYLVVYLRFHQSNLSFSQLSVRCLTPLRPALSPCLHSFAGRNGNGQGQDTIQRYSEHQR